MSWSLLEGHDRTEPTISRPLLVALQAEGARRPFFCVHPGALELQCYEPLSFRALGGDLQRDRPEVAGT